MTAATVGKPLVNPGSGKTKDHSTAATKEKGLNFKPEDLVVRDKHWSMLEACIHHLTRGKDDMAFIGSMLQSIRIDFSAEVQTACVGYRPTQKAFALLINPAFFAMMTLEQRKGVLLHELLHVVMNHLSRCPLMPDPKAANVAADFAINQLIAGLPDGDPIKALQVDDYGLPKDKSMEWYYHNLPEPPESDEDEDESDEGDGSGSNPGGKRSGKGGWKTLDSHDWDSQVDEADVLDGIEDLVQRTMIKTSRDHSSLPGMIKDVLQEIEKRRKTINWKRELRMFIKKTATGVEKENTRMRPNKRYGYQSPGLKLGEMPKLHLFIDTSGSISTVELNAFLDEIDEILKVGSRNVTVHLWHTSLYHSQKYSKSKRKDIHKAVTAGGTDFEQCAKLIAKEAPDAAIVLTDLYWGDTATKVKCPILYVGSHDGAREAPTTYPRQKMVRMGPPETKK